MSNPLGRQGEVNVTHSAADSDNFLGRAAL